MSEKEIADKSMRNSNPFWLYKTRKLKKWVFPLLKHIDDSKLLRFAAIDKAKYSTKAILEFCFITESNVFPQLN